MNSKTSGADSEVIRFERIAAKIGIDKARARASAYPREPAHWSRVWRERRIVLRDAPAARRAP